jgi:hypothetical protein
MDDSYIRTRYARLEHIKTRLVLFWDFRFSTSSCLCCTLRMSTCAHMLRLLLVPHVKTLARTPVCLHLVVRVAPDLLISDFGPCKLKARIDHITVHLHSHVDPKSAPSREKLTLPRINLLKPERLNLPVLILGLS